MNIIITGASKGIGAELVKLLRADDRVKKIVAVSRDAKKLEALKSDKVITLPFDLAQDDISSLTAEVKKNLAELDVLVNNAGALINKPFEKITGEELEAVFKVNVFSPFRLTQQLVPMMGAKAKGHIVNISSVGGYQGSAKFAGLSAYSSSK